MNNQDIIFAFDESMTQLQAMNPRWNVPLPHQPEDINAPVMTYMQPHEKKLTTERYAFRKTRRQRQQVVAQLNRMEEIANQLGIPEIIPQLHALVGPVPAIPTVSWDDMYNEATTASIQEGVQLPW